MVVDSIENLRADGCDVKFEELARQFLRKNNILVSIYEERAEGGRKLDIDSLKLSASFDLDPGSWNLRRETSFYTSQGDVVQLFTFGNLFCDDEQVLGIKDIVMAPQAD